MAHETACPECGRRWSGRRECHCAACHHHFGSPSSFDRHQVDGRCLTSAEMVTPMDATGRPRLVPSDNKYGTVWILRARTDR